MVRKMSVKGMWRGLSILSCSALLFACSNEASVSQVRSAVVEAGARVMGLEQAQAPATPTPAPKVVAAQKPAGEFKVASILAPDRTMRPGDYLWDDRAPILSGVAVKAGLDDPIETPVGALRIIDELRSAVIRDPGACQDG